MSGAYSHRDAFPSASGTCSILSAPTTRSEALTAAAPAEVRPVPGPTPVPTMDNVLFRRSRPMPSLSERISTVPSKSVPGCSAGLPTRTISAPALRAALTFSSNPPGTPESLVTRYLAPVCTSMP